LIETALIDGDLVAYRCSAACENEDVGIALWQTTEMLNRLVYETNAIQYKCFLSGSDNFRYAIYPDYKANRRDVPRPRHLQAVREHLVTFHNSVVTDGIEADDALGIEQCLSEDTLIISIDKDLLMIPGQHYAFEQTGTSSKGLRWCKPPKFTNVSPLDGLRNFYYQLIMGDRADNIPGYDGKMRAKVPQFLESTVSYLNECSNEYEMFEHVRNMYNDDDVLLRNGQCLWIQRKENDLWCLPVEEKMDRCEAESLHHLSPPGGQSKVSPEV
jgi:5'-3' exonuclease